MYDQSLAERLKLDFEQDLKDSSELLLKDFKLDPSSSTIERIECPLILRPVL